MSSLSNDYDSIEKIIYEDGLKIKALHFHPDLDLMLVVLSNKKVLNRSIPSSPRFDKAIQSISLGIFSFQFLEKIRASPS